MADENRNSESGQQKPETAKQPSGSATSSGTPTVAPSAQKSAESKPPAAETKPAAHAASPKPAGPAATPWESDLVSQLKRLHGSGIQEGSTYLGQNYIVVDASIAYEVLQYMRDDAGFDYCVDITAVHYPERERPFELIWILYSFPANQRVRVKTRLNDGESAPSVVALWPAANWLEREVFDMFGIRLEGHPDLRRILLPEEWQGHPLRKDYDILKQDTEWVQINLGIESGQ